MMGQMRFAVPLLLLVACGDRTPLGDDNLEATEGGIRDATMDRDAHDGPIPPPPPPPPPSTDGGCADFTNDPTPSAMKLLGMQCDVGENTSAPPTNGCSTVGVAWEIVPPRDMALTRIEIWTQGGGQVAFYGDDGTGRPGTRLFIGSTGGSAGAPADWRGADLAPIPLRACHRYFVHQIQGPNAYACSWASSGVDVREYTVNGNGWDGPFPGVWMARLRGACL
jgi:hypothetical protein